MARTFNGSTDVIVVADTAALRSPSTAITVAALVRVGAVSGDDYGAILVKEYTQASPYCSYMFQQEAGTRGALYFSLGDGSNQRITATTSALAASTWFLMVGRWASGEIITLRVYNMDGTVNQTVQSAATETFTIAYTTDPLRFGEVVGLNWDGDIAVAGVFDRKLSDQDIASLQWSLMAWYSQSPSGLWLFDQSATTQNVVDLTGGGANQSAITGTTVSTNSVPGFSYGADVPVPHGQAAAVEVVPPKPLILSQAVNRSYSY